MKIVVPVKQVAALDDEFELLEDGSGVDPAHVAGRALGELIERERPELVLVAHSIDALGYAPAVAAAMGLGFATDVTSVSWDARPVATRGAYGGKLVDELDFPDKDCTLLLLRAGAFAPAAPGMGSAPAREVAIDLSGVARTEHAGFGVAHYGAVIDMFELADELERELDD
jgi:electron transfer flavoprotein alpha subunit